VGEKGGGGEEEEAITFGSGVNSVVGFSDHIFSEYI
jgi:hypothetical protein